MLRFEDFASPLNGGHPAALLISNPLPVGTLFAKVCLRMQQTWPVQAILAVFFMFSWRDCGTVGQVCSRVGHGARSKFGRHELTDRLRSIIKLTRLSVERSTSATGGDCPRLPESMQTPRLAISFWRH